VHLIYCSGNGIAEVTIDRMILNHNWVSRPALKSVTVSSCLIE
jgi:hypothetical protein